MRGLRLNVRFVVVSCPQTLVVDLVSELTVLCNAITDFCTVESCPVMKAGECYRYAWPDPTPTDCTASTLLPAPKYLELLIGWVETQLSAYDNSAQIKSDSFRTNAKVFCRRLFRVYAHLFAEHAGDIQPIQIHLEYSLYHFLLFMHEFELQVSAKEIDPIQRLIDSFGVSHFFN